MGAACLVVYTNDVAGRSYIWRALMFELINGSWNLLVPKQAGGGTVLPCVHRGTVIRLNHPSKLACFPSLGRAPMLVYVRPSNEVTDIPSKLARYLFRDGG